ncbi:MAG: ATP-binding protein [Methylococcaceae bacterium]|nr:ATP-binding protein [Prolixibacteraceae bacterium]
MRISSKIKPASWFTPALLLVGFILVFGLMIWLIQLRIDRFRQSEITSQLASVAESVRLRLKGNEDYLLMLAKERAGNYLDHEQFQRRASRYVADHPELINFTWVDSSNYIRDVAPQEGNQQIIGLHLYLAEPQKASQWAKQTRHPKYTRVFEAIQGNPSFEIWVPVYNGETFNGLFAGVYSCEKVVNSLIPEQIKSRYEISLADGSGNILWQINHQQSTAKRGESAFLINTTDNGLYLRFTRIERAFIDRTLVLVMLLCLCLVIGMSYTMWRINLESHRRIQTEKELQKQNKVFAALNEEYKIQNLELQKAKEKAEVADRLKSAFLANVSHEIRTPLNSIVGFSSLLGEQGLDEETKKTYVNMVEANSESLLVLIDEILDLSKIEARQLTLKKQDFSVDHLLSELFQTFSQSNKNKKVELVVGRSVENKTLTVFSDRVRIRQVLTNFLTNAFKFTDNGYIEMGYFLSENNELVMYVKDTGIGIEKQYHQEIFHRFRKLNEDSARLYRGTGLGLAISEKIVELLGGRIWVESEPGKGSAFFFILPDWHLSDIAS